jgi:hypothetical protein
MTPTNEMRKRKTPQNMMPPMMLVVSTLVDMAYTATVIRMMDKSFMCFFLIFEKGKKINFHLKMTELCDGNYFPKNVCKPKADLL